MKAFIALTSLALCLTGCMSTRVAAELNWTIPPTSAAPDGPDAGINPPAKLVFAGNRVLPNDVYLSVLGLKEFTADAATAAAIQLKLTRFLRDAGYELSSVHCIAHDNRIDIGINEGRLEKIVYRGRLSVQSLQFTFALELPHEVFNRPELERQTALLEQQLGIGHIWFVLVPTLQVTHLGPQLEKLPEIRGFELLHEREPWELHFFFTEREWGTGAGIDVKSSYTDGLEGGINYMKEGLVLDDDRARFAASIGVGLRNRLTDNGIYPFFSRTAFDVRWYSPALVADVRPALIMKGDLVARQEIDKLIQLENYYAGTASGSLNLSAVARQGLTVSVGAGVQWRRIWGLEPSRGTITPPTVHFTEEVRAFFEGKFDLVFDPANNRTDRWHLFAAEAVTFTPASVFRDGKLTDPWFGSVHFRYQNVIPVGWHDVWIRARGRSLFGDPGSPTDSVSFHDEDSAAEYNHGIFGDKFIRRGVSAEVEFRFSITRDLFKISVFHSVFAFGEVTNRGQYINGLPVFAYEETPRLGTAIGPGFHALIEGMFQLDIYGSFGVLSNGRFSANATLNLNKVF